MQAKVYRKKISSIIQTFLRWWENVPRLLTASVRTCASPCPRELETHCWDAIYPGIVILPLHSWTSDDGIDCAAREKSATAHPVMRMETTCAKNHNESKDKNVHTHQQEARWSSSSLSKTPSKACLRALSYSACPAPWRRWARSLSPQLRKR